MCLIYLYSGGNQDFLGGHRLKYDAYNLEKNKKRYRVPIQNGNLGSVPLEGRPVLFKVACDEEMCLLKKKKKKKDEINMFLF